MFDKHILPHLGQRKMTELTRPELQAWVNELSVPTTLSKSTIEDIKLKYVTPTSITIAGQLNKWNEYTTTTKTESYKRTIPITSETYRILTKAIQSSREILLAKKSRILNQ